MVTDPIMKKIAIYGVSVMMAALVLGSCSKEDENLTDDTPREKVVYSYNLDMEAQFKKHETETSQTRAFVLKLDKKDAYTIISDTDKVVLYNQTKNVFACDTLGNCIYLRPENDKGVLEFFHLRHEIMFCRYENGEWQSVQVEPDDEYCIYYQINGVNTKEPAKSMFLFTGQTGKKKGYSDYDFYMSDSFSLSLGDDNKLTCSDIVVIDGLTSKVVIMPKFKWISGDTVTAPVQITDIMLLTTYETLVESICPIDGRTYTHPLHFGGLDEDGYLYFTIVCDYTNMDPDRRDRLFIELTGIDADGNEVYFWGIVEHPKIGFEPSCIYVREITLKETGPNVT